MFCFAKYSYLKFSCRWGYWYCFCFKRNSDQQGTHYDYTFLSFDPHKNIKFYNYNDEETNIVILHVRTVSLTLKFIFMILILMTWKRFYRPPKVLCAPGYMPIGPNGKVSLETGHLIRQAVCQEFWQRGANVICLQKMCVLFQQAKLKVLLKLGLRLVS